MDRFWLLLCLLSVLYFAQAEEQTSLFSKFVKFVLPDKCDLPRSANVIALSNGKKYFFSKPSNKNWSLAEESCTKMGLHLATLNSQEDLDVVHEKAQTIEFHASWWLSAKNRASGRQLDYRWKDGANLTLNSYLWAHNAGKSEDCIQIRTDEAANLYDQNCSYDRYFICEFPTECY
ncbi:snaclec agglucetin subunit beta-2-like [Neocloeon triangulifer]|uniref:snaclec agglucetin subunit beta-2-like n=1 Tax=Neocloeon triangulifer TaxID=2078957 RepID=UPI00286EDF5A|nr:snaclec agglucetin subunit beta-2-like [Neocloeon triangulifer]